MRFIKFAFVGFFTLGLIYVLNNPQQIGTSNIPALGAFFCPFTGFWQNAETNASFSNQEILLDLCEAPVRVVYDDRLVPHIFASSLGDAIIAQGYVTAKHRLWQMDIATRSTGGRLAEVLGESLLERDRLQRRKGLRFAAENAVKGWQKNPANFQIIENYCKGVNAFIQTLSPSQYPLEFKLLNYSPEEWTPLHTALYQKAMSEALSMREFDLEASNSLALFGKETFDFLYPEHNPKQSPIIPAEVEYNFDAIRPNPAMPTDVGLIEHEPISKPAAFIGSNNWAVAAAKTKNGHPIYCSDPHLSLTLPSYWYEVQLNTPDMNVYGVSLPGIPGVIMGFNKDIAWGMTNVGHDVVDWYQIKWASDDKRSYFLDGKATAVENRIEEIHLKDGSTYLDTVKYTVWGPIVYEAEDAPSQDMAMRWVGHDVSNPNEMGAFIKLNKAANFEEYSDALRDYDVPAQNVGFAAKDGDIAIRPSGKFPIKTQGQGRTVQDGSNSSNAWKGFIPKDQNPYVKNPSSGFIGSANQRTAHKNYPYYYNAAFDQYRGRYLHRRLAELDDITMDDMKALQNNTFSIEAEELLPLLLKQLHRADLNKDQRAVLRTLEGWDYHFDADKLAPTFYRMWSTRFYNLTWDEISNNTEVDIMKPRLWRTIDLLENAPDNAFFDTQETKAVESAKDIVSAAFAAMTAELENYKADNSALEWANYKGTEIVHLGRIPAFAYKNVPIGGYHHALNAVQKRFGPSWRMIVELGEEVNALGIYPGGQSGNPGSPYYSDMVLDWAAGKYYPLLFADTPEDIGAAILFEETIR